MAKTQEITYGRRVVIAAPGGRWHRSTCVINPRMPIWKALFSKASAGLEGDVDSFVRFDRLPHNGM